MMISKIPHTLHYCWFGEKPIPKEYEDYISSWRKYCPDFSIRKWDESNFDCFSCEYVREAYENKYWAFVSDYARFKILYEYGGVYLDTDVELIKEIDDLVDLGPYLGMEHSLFGGYDVAPGLGLAFPAGHCLIKEILDGYESRHFIKNGIPDTNYNVCAFVTDILSKKGNLRSSCEIQTIEDVTIYPVDYFCPIDFFSREMSLTSNTRSIHHYSYSWSSSKEKIRNDKLYKCISMFGRKLGPQIWYVSIIPDIIKSKMVKR